MRVTGETHPLVDLLQVVEVAGSYTEVSDVHRGLLVLLRQLHVEVGRAYL